MVTLAATADTAIIRSVAKEERERRHAIFSEAATDLHPENGRRHDGALNFTSSYRNAEKCMC